MRKKEIFEIGEPINVERIGNSPRKQLSWLAELVEGRPPQTPEDWGNLHRELVMFAMDAAGMGSFGASVRDIDLPKLSPEIVASSKNLREALKKAPWGILYAVLEILERAAARQQVSLPPQPQVADWNPKKQRYVPRFDSTNPRLRDAVLCGVGTRIFECGHLLKMCQAPAKLRTGRKRMGVSKPEQGECGKLFVARKRNQLYCSGTCLSRTLTRKKRAGKEARKPQGRGGRRKGK